MGMVINTRADHFVKIKEAAFFVQAADRKLYRRTTEKMILISQAVDAFDEIKVLTEVGG